MGSIRDIQGMKFGHLTVIDRADNNAENRAMWRCECVCGNTSIVMGKSLRSGHVKSCGCQRGNRETKYGTHAKKMREYAAWINMRQRCGNPNVDQYKYYGARGIRVCERWQRFENFLADMGPRPAGHSLERMDVNGNYEPSNCRWATKQEQIDNRREYRGPAAKRWLRENNLAPQVGWLRLE
jgi:hypothetical protein